MYYVPMNSTLRGGSLSIIIYDEESANVVSSTLWMTVTKWRSTRLINSVIVSLSSYDSKVVC